MGWGRESDLTFYKQNQLVDEGGRVQSLEQFDSITTHPGFHLFQGLGQKMQTTKSEKEVK